ncbi:MAG: type V CRISPR-associated protein Cas12b [Luteolibacter sp.]
MPLSRIYQGRVTRLKLLDDKKATDGAALPPSRMEDLLSRHHAEFQKAVNYHQFQLLRLSIDESSPLGKIRKRMVEADIAARRLKANDCVDEKEKRGLQEIAAHDVWNDFRRNGRRRPGMAGSVTECLGMTAATPLAEAFARADERFNDAGVGAELYDTAVRALVDDLGGDGAIQQKGREYLPRFCDPAYSGSYPRSATALGKKAVQAELPQRLHDPETAGNLDKLRFELEFEHFAIVNETGKALDRDACLTLLKEGIGLLVAESGLAAGDAARLLEKCSALPETMELPAYRGASVKGILRNRFFAFLVFKHLEASPVTFAVLRDTYPAPKAAKSEKPENAPKKHDGPDLMRFGDDPVKLARGKTGVIYPGYTSFATWASPGNGKMGWKEFDIAAFKEALKAFNQVKGRNEERMAELEKTRAMIYYMENGGKAPRSKSGEDEEDMQIATFAEDNRFARFQTLLAELKTQDGEDAEEYAAEDSKGLRFRAIRGRKELFAAWNKAMRKTTTPTFDDKGHETGLLALLNEHQADHRDDMGWSLLFRALCKELNWDFWREPSTEEAQRRRELNHSNDFLADYVKWSDLRIEAARLEQPIRFSPADEEQSRRLFMFSDACKFTPKGEFRHLAKETAVIVPMAVEAGGYLVRKRVRLDYAAPRMLRDGLRGAEGGAVWNQPMMAALGMEARDAAQDISKSAVALMPDRDREGDLRFLLNFPLSLDESGVIAKVAELRGQSLDWARHSVSYGKGDSVQHFYLRWPGFDKEVAGITPWQKATKTFRVLSVDLGVRFAGAGARLRGTMDKPDKGHFRKIGTCDEQDWFAQVERLITFRLPGEDRRGMEHGDHEDGRWASDAEISAAREVIRNLGLEPGDLEGSRHRIGEAGAKLLFALRRAISRLRSLHRWARMAENWEGAKGEIEELKKRAAEASKGETRWSRRLKDLHEPSDCRAEAYELTREIQTAINQTADLLVPLRHGSWRWEKTSPEMDGRPACFLLTQVSKTIGEPAKRNRDQGGLSIARIDRITSFRKVLLSFNRLCGLEPGTKPPSGREMRAQPLPDPCKELSDKLEAMKEQRVNQTAHLILAEALGLELKPHDTTRVERQKIDLHGEYIRKRPPVDFIVIEDLARYRTTQGRTRQENSRLMQWCHRQISAKLKELCEAYGIAVLETPAAYSSRFCSLTGQPGFRAEHLTKRSFAESFYWRHAVERAEREAEGKKTLSISSQGILKLRDRLAALPDGSKETLLAPRPGGGIFVPAGDGIIQNADLNAAVNLGLRAIAAPDQFGIHSRVRSEWREGSYRTRETRNRFGPKPVPIQVGDLKLRDDGSAPEALDAKPNFFLVAGVLDPGFDRAELNHAAFFGARLFSARALWKTVNDKSWTRDWR